MNGQVSGQVELIGYERDALGTQIGVRAVNATGVHLYLLSGQAVVDSALSIDGQYIFDDVPQGAYAVSSEVAPGVSDTTAGFVVGDGDVTLEDPVRLRSSSGRLVTYPNPLSPHAILAFPVDVADSVLLEVVDVSLLRVRVLISGHKDAGTHEVVWDATDENGQPVSPGSYWAIVWQSSSVDADLVFVGE